MRELELASGEVIERVTRVSEPEDGLVHVHTPGPGYRVVRAEDVVREDGAGIVVCHAREDHDAYGGRGAGGADIWTTNVGKRGWLGNPFALEDGATREGVIADYARVFLDRLAADAGFREAVEDLRGKRVACWCRRSDEDEPACHLDVVDAYLRDGEEAVESFADEGAVPGEEEKRMGEDEEVAADV